MFLAQSVKKFLKENFQDEKNAKKKDDDFFQRMKDFECGCGLDPDDTSSDPAFHSLMGNTWHGMFAGDD
ncbi:MAG: hypothetical protein COX19_05680 [Desulfobacterales bacterium CG23_combo_of_CG06-09_8_20_14_all_51_8]|nr:MAG: hypothetical protein COX19_05680 [Desulfobacterales bacterium CG23_combo_of_CG06-09_8_20_14_all_51_8]